MAFLTKQVNVAPQTIWQTSPTESQHPIAPVDDNDMPAKGNGSDDTPRDFLHRHEHGIFLAGKQRCVNKSRPYIGEGDVEPTARRKLLKGLDISALEGFRGAIGRCGAKSFSYGYRGYDGNVTVPLPLHLPESLAHHTHKAQGIGLGGRKLNVFVEFQILPSNARHMQIEIHMPHSLKENFQLPRGICLSDVNLFHHSPALVRGKKLLKRCRPSGTKPHSPSVGKQLPRHLMADTRRGTHDNCCLHNQNNAL